MNLSLLKEYRLESIIESIQVSFLTPMIFYDNYRFYIDNKLVIRFKFLSYNKYDIIVFSRLHSLLLGYNIIDLDVFILGLAKKNFKNMRFENVEIVDLND